MNKFMVEPESVGSLLGCAFWLAFLAAGMALFFAAMLSPGW